MTITEEYAGQKLGIFLRKMGCSSSLIRSLKHIPNGICLNGQLGKTNVVLAKGDSVCLCLPPEEQPQITPQAIPLEIVYESRHALVVNKPAGLAAHPTLNYTDGTLANAVAHYALQKNEPMVFRPIGRLDRNTSGLMLVAKNRFSGAYMQHKAQKTYTALAQGFMQPGSGEICVPIKPADASIIKQQVAADGKYSHTRYVVKAASPLASLVEVTPLTGRTHQIRVHFAHIGHPLCGDTLYGAENTLIPRHALHCSRLVFSEPDEGEIDISIDISPDIANALRLAKIDVKCEL